MAKNARVYDGSKWQDLVSSVADLTPYSTTEQMNTAIDDAKGLVLVKTQTIGTTVTSVAVSDAFSTDYDNYKIIVNGGVGSTNADLSFIFTGNTAGYYSGGTQRPFSNTNFISLGVNNGAAWTIVGQVSSSQIFVNMDVFSPFLSKNATYAASFAALNTAGSGLHNSGFHNNTSSFTGFTLTSSTGTLTGGTIRVYGYKI